VKDEHEAYLTRTARRLSRDLGKTVSKKDILEAILDLAIQDEELFDPEDHGQPISAERRAVMQVERTLRTVDLSPHELLRIVLANSGTPPHKGGSQP
jgi:hypothetical protein